MTTQNNPPQYNNEPVILVHLTNSAVDDENDLMYWCAPYKVVEYEEGAYPDIPLVSCPACFKASR